jgi:hypothetical protein
VNSSDLEKNLPTNEVPFNFADEILNAPNNKMHVGAIICDLTKAFDCANHKL